MSSSFPLIPLPIKEAIINNKLMTILLDNQVSINSTSYKRSDAWFKWWWKAESMFPLIPLPIKEAISHVAVTIKLAIILSVSINSTSYKRSDLPNGVIVNAVS